MHDFDWFLERLDVAKWTDQERGNRDALFNCPVHGGSDSLHITEKNSKAIVHCFNPTCGAGYLEVVEALESRPESEEGASDADSEETPRAAKTPTVTRRGRAEKSAEASKDGEAETGGAAPPRLHQKIDPLDWTAQRCGMTRKELDALKLPLRSNGDNVVFVFDGGVAVKLRQVGEGKKKMVSWVNDGSRPELWPVPASPSPEITICEGEFDAICLRQSGIEAYSVTAGAGTPIDQVTWESLRNIGVTAVNVVYDLDREGRKGRDQALEDARAAGLTARPMRPAGINPLVGDKDVRDAVRANGYPVVLEDDVTEDAAVSLDTIIPSAPEPLLLGWLHPYEHTVLFGDGGTGKGVIAAQWVADLASEGKNVLVVDYEQHAMYEWRPRVGRFACGHATPHIDPPCATALKILQRVYYVQPVAPIWEIASWLRSEAKRVGADYIVIDSVSYAVSGMEPEKSVTAVKYTQAINAIGLPVLSIGHVTKSNANPNHPFGSVYWHNGARLTIGVYKRDEALDSDRIVTHKKANQGQAQQDMAIDWSWLSSDLPASLTAHKAWTSGQQAFNAMTAQQGTFPTLNEVEQAIGEEITDGAFRQFQSRYMKDVRAGKAPPPRRRAGGDVGSSEEVTNDTDE